MSCLNTVSRRFAFVSCLLVLMTGSASAEEVIDTSPRSGVTLRMLVDHPAEVRAVALLFPGGHGKVLIQDNGAIKGLKGNFLLRIRDRFIEGGIATAIFDAPSDHQDKEGLTAGYRATPEHASDIGKALASLRERFPGKPVWLVGTSRGSTSVGNAAANPSGSPADGVVMTSSIGVSSVHGNVREFDLAAIKMPALVMHHKNDGCKLTPPEGSQGIYDDLKGSARRELIIMEGGVEEGNPCQGASYHGYMGIDEKAADIIVAWINKR